MSCHDQGKITWFILHTTQTTQSPTLPPKSQGKKVFLKSSAAETGEWRSLFPFGPKLTDIISNCDTLGFFIARYITLLAAPHSIQQIEGKYDELDRIWEEAVVAWSMYYLGTLMEELRNTTASRSSVELSTSRIHA
jgi:hypothetical protein